MSRRILIVLSEWGYWGEELIGPLETFDAAGYQVDFATPTGKRPVALPPSMDAEYVDPPLGRSVTTPEVAQKVKDLEASARLDNPINLSELLPDAPTGARTTTCGSRRPTSRRSRAQPRSSPTTTTRS